MAVKQGYADFILPTAIVEQIIEKIKVDITAQTLPELKVDITAQTLATLNVNIAESTITLPINITASTIILDVNVQAQAIILDVYTPYQTSTGASGVVSVGPGVTLSLISLTGKGEIEFTYLFTSGVSDGLIDFIFVIDGVEHTLNLEALNSFTNFQINVPSLIVPTLIDDTAKAYRLHLLWHIRFKEAFELKVTNRHTTDKVGAFALIWYATVS